MTGFLGLTGGMGVGKSTVAGLLARLGLLVLSADEIAHDCLHSSHPLYHRIVLHFGSDILNNQGEIDRPRLRTVIFNDLESKSWLEDCLHPVIWDVLEQRASQANSLGSPYVVLEVPLLIERGYANRVHRILLVEAAMPVRLQRIQARTGMPVHAIETMIGSQASPEWSRQYAHDRIDNSGSMADLEHQVHELHTHFLKYFLANQDNPRRFETSEDICLVNHNKTHLDHQAMLLTQDSVKKIP